MGTDTIFLLVCYHSLTLTAQPIVVKAKKRLGENERRGEKFLRPWKTEVVDHKSESTDEMR